MREQHPRARKQNTNRKGEKDASAILSASSYVHGVTLSCEPLADV
jgi:hypothetical protein